jgi:nucleoside-diphosphate-sugar epimerase
MPPRLFIFGLGYSARVLARRVLATGGQVAGTVREPAAVATLRAAGITAFRFDTGQALDPAALHGATHVLSSVPPDEHGDPAWWSARNLIAAQRATVHWLGYLSTTGVWGDRQGGWVDETTTPAPGNARSAWRLVAEAQWLELGREIGVPAQVFRLPGIYGPGRSALDQVQSGTARRIDKPGHAFSRIHVEDIATTVLASMERPRDGAVYIVADDEPAPSADVVALACTLLGRPVPAAVPYDQAVTAMTPMARSFWAENRRVRNDLIKRELGVVLKYPTYREGLCGILADGNGPAVLPPSR